MSLEERLKKHAFRFERLVIRRVVTRPATTPFYDSTMGPFNDFPYFWLTLYDEDGTYGEAPSSERINLMFPRLLLDGSKRSYYDWHSHLYWQIRNRGFRSEAASELGSIDIAIHDIMAKREGLALHRFWGATRDSVTVYGSGAGINLDESAVAKELSDFVAAGYDTVKMKVGSDWGTDVERDVRRVAAARKAIGPDVRLAIDANQCWTAGQALRFIDRVAKYDIAWFEEPVHSADLVAMRELAEECPIGIAAGESERTYFGFRDMASVGVKQLQPCIMKLPAVLDWMKVRDLTIERGLELTSGGFSPLTAAFIATASEDSLTEYLVPLLSIFIETLGKKPELRDGCFYLSSDPGLPIQPEWEKLENGGLVTEVMHFHKKNM